MVDRKKNNSTAREKKYDYWIFALFLVLVSLFLYPIFLGKVFFPGDLLYQYPPWSLSSSKVLKEVLPINNPLLGDPVTAFYPWYTFMHKAFKEGFLPLWNPLVMTGTPFLANWQSGTLAIENLFFYVLKTPLALNIHIFFKVFLALSFTYLFLRKLKLSHEAAIFGGITYTFSAFFVVWLNWPQTRVAIWLPLTLFTIEHLLGKPDLRRMAFVALATAAAILAGHPGTLVMSLMIIFVYSFSRIFLVSEDGHFPGKVGKDQVKELTFVIGGLALGFAIGALLILPGIEMIKNSYQYGQRGATNYLDVSLRPNNLVLLFFFKFYGHLKDGIYIGRSNFNEISSYVGILPLFFSFWALTYFRKIKKTWPMFFLAAFSLVLIFGFWPQKLLYKLPVISMQPTQRFIFILTFSLSVLAAFGFDIFFSESKSRWRFLTLAGLYLIVLTAIFYKINPIIWATYKIHFFLLAIPFLVLLAVYVKKDIKQLSWILILTLALDLFLFGFSLNSYVKNNLVYKKEPVIEFIKQDKKLYRVFPLVDTMMPNSLMSYGLEDLRGRDALITKNLIEFSNLTKDSLSFPQLPNFFLPNKVNTPLIDFLNVKYVVSEVPMGNTLPRRIISSNGFVEVYDKSSQKQTFVAEEDNLAGVGLLVGNFKIVNNPTALNFKILDNEGVIVRSTRVSVGYFRDNAYYSINFKPITSSKGKKYSMIIEGPDVPRKYHTALYISNYDQYPKGVHFDAGKEREGDLTFYLQYYQPVSKFKQVFRYKSLKVYKNTSVLPRAYAVNKAVIIKSPKKALSYLARGQLDYREQVVLNHKPRYSGEIRLYKGSNQVSISSYKPNKIRIRAKLNRKSIIVISDNYYPGWKAYVDGKEAPLYVANTSFRGVAVNAGEHKIKLVYKPALFRKGLVISLSSLLLVLGFISWPFFNKSRLNEKR